MLAGIIRLVVGWMFQSVAMATSKQLSNGQGKYDLCPGVPLSLANGNQI